MLVYCVREMNAAHETKQYFCHLTLKYFKIQHVAWWNVNGKNVSKSRHTLTSCSSQKKMNVKLIWHVTFIEFSAHTNLKMFYFKVQPCTISLITPQCQNRTTKNQNQTVRNKIWTMTVKFSSVILYMYCPVFKFKDCPQF